MSTSFWLKSIDYITLTIIDLQLQLTTKLKLINNFYKKYWLFVILHVQFCKFFIFNNRYKLKYALQQDSWGNVTLKLLKIEQAWAS